ncbi:MAG: DUF2953 domain-containing protein [Firmicutes bacterium]|nr:DUF2953 domain-containing protein [Bacillota bacterium]
MRLAIISGVFLCLAVIVLLSPVTVEIKYTYYKLNASQPDPYQEYVPERSVRFSLLWGLLKPRLKLSYFKLGRRAFNPALKIKTTLAQSAGPTLAEEKTTVTIGRAIELYKLAAKIYQAAKPAFRYLLARSKLHHFHWSTGLGLPEAWQTGIATGLLWSLKSNAVAWLYRTLEQPAPKPELEVTPIFNGQGLRIHFDCIFSFRSGHIIYTGLLAGWYYLRNKRKFNL